MSSGAGPWAKLNQAYASYADQVGFFVDAARVRTPTDKGKIERRAQEVDGLGLETRCFVDLEDLQRVTDARISRRAAKLVNALTGTSLLEAWHRAAGPPPLPHPRKSGTACRYAV